MKARITNKMVMELRRWLNSQTITGENIGKIRRQCFMPWDSEWNGLVRDETAKREKIVERQMKATITGKSYFGKIGDTVEVAPAEGATLEVLQTGIKGKWFGIIPKGFGGPVCWTHESQIRVEHDERADAFEWLRSQALSGNQDAVVLIDELLRLKDYDNDR